MKRSTSKQPLCAAQFSKSIVFPQKINVVTIAVAFRLVVTDTELFLCYRAMRVLRHGDDFILPRCGCQTVQMRLLIAWMKSTRELLLQRSSVRNRDTYHENKAPPATERLVR